MDTDRPVMPIRVFCFACGARAFVSGCRILRGYPTTAPGYLAWLSDSLRLSDNCARRLALVVGFCVVIRQLRQEAWPGCRILRGYPTTALEGLDWLSDSAWLSDNPKYFFGFQ